MIACHPIRDDRVGPFLALGRRLGAGDPEWIPPLTAPLMAELTGADLFGAYSQRQLFLCERNGQMVGRIGAVINPRLLDADGAVVGQLAYFECEDDAELARALIDTAAGWLADRGARSLLGPICGGTHRLHRFLIDGFDTEPFLFEPRNPPHYPRLFEAAGFEIAHQWMSYEFSIEAIERMRRVMTAIARRVPSGYRIELCDPADALAVVARIHPIIDALWEGHLGYAPLDLDEFGQTYGGLLAVMSHGHIGVLHDESTGRDVGCALYYPDYAREVRDLDGDATRWASWKQSAEIRRYVLHTVALVPEARNTGASASFIAQALTQIEAGGAKPFMAGLVTEDMTFFSKFTQPTRRYALYARDL